MGNNSKMHKKELEKRIAESGTPPIHPSNEDIFAEYETIGGIIRRRVQKNPEGDTNNKSDNIQ